MLGMQRALFSNEAGQGSSPVAHSAAKTKEPIREGVVAGLEPFVDTIVVCTMSALVILISGVWNRPAEIFINEAVFTPVSENEWQLSTDDSFYAQLSADQMFLWWCLAI
jgi:AGCS family alanine or glycine:cation symporter